MRGYLCILDIAEDYPVRILTYDYSDAEEAYKHILRVWGYEEDEIEMYSIVVEEERK